MQRQHEMEQNQLGSRRWQFSWLQLCMCGFLSTMFFPRCACHECRTGAARGGQPLDWLLDLFCHVHGVELVTDWPLLPSCGWCLHPRGHRKISRRAYGYRLLLCDMGSLRGDATSVLSDFSACLDGLASGRVPNIWQFSWIVVTPSVSRAQPQFRFHVCRDHAEPAVHHNIPLSFHVLLWWHLCHFFLAFLCKVSFLLLLLHRLALSACAFWLHRPSEPAVYFFLCRALHCQLCQAASLRLGAG
mmetsp:Transcript_19746/g.37144  ORF Transcript_19746/g.37144 Transcript_19746/m.37144 type:complete len:244 (+) Transcript_19746:143-874(+)